MLMILDDTSTIKQFKDDTNTVNTEHFTNKELHLIKNMVKITYIIIKILIENKCFFSNA